MKIEKSANCQLLSNGSPIKKIELGQTIIKLTSKNTELVIHNRQELHDFKIQCHKNNQQSGILNPNITNLSMNLLIIAWSPPLLV